MQQLRQNGWHLLDAWQCRFGDILALNVCDIHDSAAGSYFQHVFLWRKKGSLLCTMFA